jgi:hypothetical protein
MNVFDPVQGMVGRASRYGGQIVAQRNPAGSSLIKKLTGTSAGAAFPRARRNAASPRYFDLSIYPCLGRAHGDEAVTAEF